MSGDAAYDVVGFGQSCLDHLIVVPHAPTPGEKFPVETYVLDGGGPVATPLAALAKWGRKCLFFGTFGDDDVAGLIRARLEAAGVSTAAARVRPGVASHSSVILIERGTGERTILWKRDPRLRLEPKELDRKTVTCGRMLYLDGRGGEADAVAARWAKEAGRRVVLDIERADEWTREILRWTDCAVGCEGFPERFTEKSDRRAALQAIHELGPSIVGETLGPCGSILFDGRRWIETAGFKVATVDTTGAGDIFHAGLAHGLLSGWDLEACAGYANAAAALSTTAIGGRAGVPTEAEALRLARDPRAPRRTGGG